MSFILDALKKSEIERQEQAGPSVAHVREAPPDSHRPLWIAAIAALLAINLIALLIFAFRAPAEPAAPVVSEAPERTPSIQSRQPSDSAAGRQSAPARAPVAAASREVRPLSAETPVAPAATIAPAPSAEGDEEPALAAASPAASATDDESGLPTFNELLVAGRIELPPLHLDIHVYSDLPLSRFVFIDGRKYREGERLAAGPQVERITEAGVVLSHQGERFLLPRM